MTLPQGIPVSPTIEALRRALRDHDDEYGVNARWSPPHASIIDAARTVLAEYDTQVQAMNVAMRQAAERAVLDMARGQAHGTLGL